MFEKSRPLETSSREVSRRAKGAVVGLVVLVAVLALAPVAWQVRKRVYVRENMEILNSLPVYPGSREQHTFRDEEYNGPDDSDLSLPDGWGSRRTYAAPPGIRMRPVYEFYDREMLRRGWKKESPDCGPGSFEKGEARVLVNAGAVNPRDPQSGYDLGVDAHGADEC